MKEDNELESWRRLWLSQPAAPLDLIRTVERRTVHMRLERIAEILMTVFIGGGLLVWALLQRNVDIALFTGGTWLFILIGWRLSIASTRGMWAAGAFTAASYLDLAIERCRRDIRAIWWINVLLPPGWLFGLIMGNKIVADEGRWELSSFLITLSIAVAILVSVLVATNASKRRGLEPRLAYLLDLQRQIADTTPADEKNRPG